METLQHPLGQFALPVAGKENKENLVKKFLNWTEAQNGNRIAWLALALAGHGCFLTPVTVFFIMMSGNNFVFFPFALGAMVMCLVVNLAALPTRITIPVFALSVLIDLVIIINCIITGLQWI